MNDKNLPGFTKRYEAGQLGADLFKASDSPRTLDLTADLGGRPCRNLLIVNDGPGDLRFSGAVQGGEPHDLVQVKPGESHSQDEIVMTTLVIFWLEDTAYRITAQG